MSHAICSRCDSVVDVVHFVHTGNRLVIEPEPSAKGHVRLIDRNTAFASLPPTLARKVTKRQGKVLYLPHDCS